MTFLKQQHSQQSENERNLKQQITNYTCIIWEKWNQK